ncbi:hypothetical protein OE88DRAFT_252978 [Heliocybe sulcata]|uniref:Uncharacterized protein n=1 Tax=Heliocybe sulcata TaxID=5364 RepID=A0A5C3MYL5_9AGAM|nr:hypothetical protein OE88DRAFT_252978 [Heliocybe sulcata]
MTLSTTDEQRKTGQTSVPNSYLLCSRGQTPTHADAICQVLLCSVELLCILRPYRPTSRTSLLSSSRVSDTAAALRFHQAHNSSPLECDGYPTTIKGAAVLTLWRHIIYRGERTTKMPNDANHRSWMSLAQHTIRLPSTAAGAHLSFESTGCLVGEC